jgi:hypothetical protein
MATAVMMRAALQQRGLNIATADYFMTEQGFENPTELMMTSRDALDTMVKNAIKSSPDNVAFSAVAIRKLNAFKRWADERHMCGLSLSPADLTAEELEIYVLLQRADAIKVAARKEQKPIMPDILKHEKEWFKFYEKLKNYLGQVRGAAQSPILNIVREHDEPIEAIRGATYSSHTKKVSAIINLSGQHFAIDNASAWEIVKSLVIDGFGWNYVKRFDRNMDGRAAVLALRRQCEGKTSINTRKNKAYLSISSSSYKGHRKTYTFAQYVAIHQAAHNELEDCNEPMPETKKVSDFIRGISDPSLEAGVTCVLSDDKYSSDFEATQQFLGTLVANQAVHRQAKRVTNEDRKVSLTNSAAGTKGSNKKQKPQPRIGNRYYSNAEQVKEIKKKAKEQHQKVLFVN